MNALMVIAIGKVVCNPPVMPLLSAIVENNTSKAVCQEQKVD